MTKVFDIAILGYYGFGNLGDELLLEAVISLLLMSGISKEKIVILSNSPAETEEKYGVKSINRWNVKGIFNTLLKSKSFLLGGGGLFQDVTSIKSVLYYWFMIKLAQLAHAKPWAVGQSVGPLKRNVSRNFTKNAFKSCINVVARDVKSYSLLSKWGANVSIAPDLVLSFPVNTINFSARDTVLFNIRPGYESLAHDLVDFVVKNSVGKEIIGVAF